MKAFVLSLLLAAVSGCTAAKVPPATSPHAAEEECLAPYRYDLYIFDESQWVRSIAGATIEVRDLRGETGLDGYALVCLMVPEAEIHVSHPLFEPRTVYASYGTVIIHLRRITRAD